MRAIRLGLPPSLYDDLPAKSSQLSLSHKAERSGITVSWIPAFAEITAHITVFNTVACALAS